MLLDALVCVKNSCKVMENAIGAGITLMVMQQLQTRHNCTNSKFPISNITGRVQKLFGYIKALHNQLRNSNVIKNTIENFHRVSIRVVGLMKQCLSQASTRWDYQTKPSLTGNTEKLVDRTINRDDNDCTDVTINDLQKTIQLLTDLAFDIQHNMDRKSSNVHGRRENLHGRVSGILVNANTENRHRLFSLQDESVDTLYNLDYTATSHMDEYCRQSKQRNKRSLETPQSVGPTLDGGTCLDSYRPHMHGSDRSKRPRSAFY